MYKLVLAEDEDIIKEGIIKSISWSELGFEIVADASDGSVALDKIRLLQPDVLLTDIKMPNMDGIELIKNVVSEFPEMKVLILSGFNEVEYLHEAIKMFC